MPWIIGLTAFAFLGYTFAHFTGGNSDAAGLFGCIVADLGGENGGAQTAMAKYDLTVSQWSEVFGDTRQVLDALIKTHGGSVTSHRKSGILLADLFLKAGKRWDRPAVEKAFPELFANPPPAPPMRKR